MSYKREMILNTFQELAINKFGTHLEKINELGADASERKIYRLFSNGKSVIGIYNENEKENLAFFNFTQTFLELGFNVPVIISISDDNLCYLEEDLGDLTLFKFSTSGYNQNLFEYYKQALSDLIRFQIEAKDKIDYNICCETKVFDSETIKLDIEEFNQYFVKTFLKDSFNDEVFNSILMTSVTAAARASDKFFLYRDFQPRNIMLKDNLLYYIDYQSGRKGPLQYDLASFLYSGSIFINEDERKRLLHYYTEELSRYITYDVEEFKYYFYYFVFLRLMQVLGTYAYLYKTRNDHEVLNKIPKAMINLKSLVDKIDDKSIKDFIVELTASKN